MNTGKEGSMPHKKENAPTVQGRRVSVKNDQHSLAPWTPKAQAALVADFALFVGIYILLVITGVFA